MSTPNKQASRGSGGHPDDRSPQPARPGDRGHPAAERQGGRSEPRTTSTSSSTRSVKPGQVVSKDVETNIKYWIGEIDKKLSAQLNEVMHHPDFQQLGVDLARAALPRQPVARPARPSRSASSTSTSRSCSRTWRRPSSSTRAPCSRRSTRKNTASSAASRTACWSATTSSAAAPRTSAC